MRYEKWLNDIMGRCRVLNVNAGTALEYASIRTELRRIGRPIPGNDIWIEALARQYAMSLVSRDAHFDYVPKLKRIDW